MEEIPVDWNEAEAPAVELWGEGALEVDWKVPRTCDSSSPNPSDPSTSDQGF
jgi:hypothetical protein